MDFPHLNPPLRRVIPLARSLLLGTATVSFLSIEDLTHEFVIRMAVWDPHHSRSPVSWNSASFTSRDQRATAYQGGVVSASPIPGGVDLVIACWPGLDPATTLLELTLGPPSWGVSVIASLDSGPPTTLPFDSTELGLSAAGARVLELAERVALLMGVPVGPEHLLLSSIRLPAGDETRRTLEAVNLQHERVRAAIETQPAESAHQGAFELLSALHTAEQAARHLGDVCIRPEHLLLGVLDEGGTRVDRLLLGLDVPRQLVRSLLDSQLAARAGPIPDQSRRQLRRVAAVCQTQTTAPHALTLMSVEDYGTDFVVRGHLGSSTGRLEHAVRLLTLSASDDRGRSYACVRTATTGYANDRASAIDVAWTSTSELDSTASMLCVTAPELGCRFAVQLDHAMRVRHA